MRGSIRVRFSEHGVVVKKKGQYWAPFGANGIHFELSGSCDVTVLTKRTDGQSGQISVVGVEGVYLGFDRTWDPELGLVLLVDQVAFNHGDDQATVIERDPVATQVHFWLDGGTVANAYWAVDGAPVPDPDDPDKILAPKLDAKAAIDDVHFAENHFLGELPPRPGTKKKAAKKASKKASKKKASKK